MTANVTLLLDSQTDVLLLPSTAIRRIGTQSFVNLLKADGTTEQRPITTGGTDGTNTSITSGLAEGDRVALGAVGGAATTPAAARTARPTPAGGVR
jgi:multidrug efflux pump subunit AcrA (membrane-fusion protein)